MIRLCFRACVTAVVMACTVGASSQSKNGVGNSSGQAITQSLTLVGYGLGREAAPVGASEPARDEETICSLNNEWLKAYDAGEANTLDRIEDPSFVASGDLGEVTKQQQLDFGPTARREIVGGQPDNRKPTHSILRVVARVTETDRYTSAEGTHGFQSTEMWVKRDDGWKTLHLHFSAMRNGPCAEQFVKTESGREGAGVSSLVDDMYFSSHILEYNIRRTHEPKTFRFH